MTDAFHAIVRGLVQGVSFRFYTRNFAERILLNGWVRNLSDGSVEVHALGEKNRLLELEQWLHKGPPSARVDALELHWLADEDPSEVYCGFEIRR